MNLSKHPVMNCGTPILATDLDGTLIPSEPMNLKSPETRALQHLGERAKSGELEIIFVTGRHFESVIHAIQSIQLPTPQWIICDVGSSIYHFNGIEYGLVDCYRNHLHDITCNQPPSALSHMFEGLLSMQLQEAEKQSINKLSYYCEATDVEGCVESIDAILRSNKLPHSVIHSLDPFSGDGLIDIMPRGVNKAYALHWWSEWKGIDHDRIVFAGDSGNDFDALTSRYRGIVVGNAETGLVSRILEHHRIGNTSDRIYLAQSAFTAGVLEGCLHFGIVEDDYESPLLPTEQGN